MKDKKDDTSLHCMCCNLVYVPHLDVYVHKRDYEEHLELDYGRYSSGVCDKIQCGVEYAKVTAGEDSDLEREILLDWADCNGLFIPDFEIKGEKE